MTNIQTVLFVAVVALGLALMVTSDGSTSHYLDCLSPHQCMPTKTQPDWRCCPEKYCCYEYQWQSRDTYSKCIPKADTKSQYCNNFSMSADQLADKRYFVPPKTSVCSTLAVVTGDASYMNFTDVPGTQEFLKCLFDWNRPTKPPTVTLPESGLDISQEQEEPFDVDLILG